MNSNKSLVAVANLLGLAGGLVIALIFAQHYVEGRLREGLDHSIAGSADKMKVTYRNVKVSLIRCKIDINDLEFTPVGNNPNQLSLGMDRIEISDIDDASLLRMVVGSSHKTIPASLRLTLDGMHFTPEILGDKASKSIAELGYEELKVSMSVGLKTDRQEKTFKLEDLNIDVADFGKLSTTWAFSNVELPTDEELQNPELMKAQAKERAMKISLHYADVRWEDHSLLSRIDANLKKTGKPSLAQSVQMLGALAQPRGPAKLAFLSDAIPKLQDFATKGGAIALKAKPPTDMTFVQLVNPLNLIDPNAFAQQIGLSLEVTH